MSSVVGLESARPGWYSTAGLSNAIEGPVGAGVSDGVGCAEGSSDGSSVGELVVCAGNTWARAPMEPVPNRAKIQSPDTTTARAVRAGARPLVPLALPAFSFTRHLRLWSPRPRATPGG